MPWRRDHAASDGSDSLPLSESLILPIAARAPPLLAGAKDPSPQHLESPRPKSKEAPDIDEGAEDDEQLFVDILDQLEFHEECEVMTSSASSENLASPKVSGEPEETVITAEPLTTAVLLDVLRRIRLRELPEADVALRIVEEVRVMLRDSCSSLVRVSVPAGRLVVIGDIHGHLNDLLHLLDAIGQPSEFNHVLFNGDFVDRGDWGPEVLLAMFCLKLIHPGEVHLNRGNHEDDTCNTHYGFKDQILRAEPYKECGVQLYKLIQDAFNQLPLCHVINDKVFVVHGGLPLERITLADIEAVPRGPVPLPAKTNDERIFASCLWSDPRSQSAPSCRGAGFLFDKNVTQRFLEANGLNCIIRSHECIPEGVREQHFNKAGSPMVWTVFSASNYNHVAGGNRACMLFIDADCNISKAEAWEETHVKFRQWDAAESLADRVAIDRLDRSLEIAKTEQLSSRQQALKHLQRMIFLARPLLLDAFEQVDSCKNGRISPECWAGVMATCLRTPPEFPWAAVGPHLFHLDDDGCMAYADFIFRYFNPLSRWLAEQWCTAALSEISYRLGDAAGMEFFRLDVNKGRRGSCTGFLSYNELRPLIYQQLPTSSRDAQMQSLHVLALFRRLDSNGSGFITREEFLDAIEQAAQQFAKCPKDHFLQEVRSVTWRLFGEQRECDACGRAILHTEMRRHCYACDYDLCELCVGTTSRVQSQWDAISAAVNVLCRSQIDAYALFSLADVNGDGFVDRREFVTCISELLPPGGVSPVLAPAAPSSNRHQRNSKRQSSRDLPQVSSGNILVAEALWDLAWQQEGTNPGSTPCRRGQKMRVSDFQRCLDVVDAEALPKPRRSASHGSAPGA